MAQCLITGCAVVDEAYPRWRWGDLFQEGTAFIHNSEQEWVYAPLPDNRKALILQAYSHPFEKGGVIVVRALDASLNETALAYLKGENHGE